MTQSRIWTFAAALVIVVLIAGTWFLAVSPRLAEAAVAGADLVVAETQNAAQTATLERLKTQFAGIDTLRSDLAVVQKAVPAEAAQAPLLGALSDMAAARGVTLTGVSLTDPAPFVPFPSEDPLVSEPLSSLTSENFFTYSVQISLTGSYSAMMDFVSDLQGGERLVLVNNLALSEGEGEGPEYTLSGLAFVLVDADTAAANAPAPAAIEPGAEGGAPL